MADQVNWSPKALIDAIVAYIARDYAATVVQKILDTTRNLSKFPLTGRVPEFSDESIG